VYSSKPFSVFQHTSDEYISFVFQFALIVRLFSPQTTSMDQLWERFLEARKLLGPEQKIFTSYTNLRKILIDFPWLLIPVFSGLCCAHHENKKRQYGPTKLVLNYAKRAAQSTVLCAALGVESSILLGPEFLIHSACNLTDFTCYSSYAFVRWTWEMIEWILTG
jgi:hypothetical protein